jgi:hypothetical protein
MNGAEPRAAAIDADSADRRITTYFLDTIPPILLLMPVVGLLEADRSLG